MKIWLDDIRLPPKGYEWVLSVNSAKALITKCIKENISIEILDLDHDLGDYASCGGDGIKLVLWLAENELYLPINVHSANPVGKENMEAIIKRYWTK